MSMVQVEMSASAEIQRHLDTTVRPWDHRRTWCDGRFWTRAGDGVWVTPHLVPETPGDMRDIQRPDGRRPDLMILDDTVELFGKKRAAEEKAAGDMRDALRGARQELAHAPDGKERVDFYPPVKNADGTLNKYAKNLIDIHAPAQRIEREIGEHFRTQTGRE